MTDAERLNMIHDAYQELIMSAFYGDGTSIDDYKVFADVVEIALAGKIHLVFEEVE